MYIVEMPEKEQVVQWVEEYWLDRHFEVSLLANSMKHPKVTASYTDMPYHATGGINNSSVESDIVEKISAEEWLAIFDEALDQLPFLHREIIALTYLKKESDIVICRELNIGRSFYFKKRKEGLYWLGLALWHKSVPENYGD